MFCVRKIRQFWIYKCFLRFSFFSLYLKPPKLSPGHPPTRDLLDNIYELASYVRFQEPCWISPVNLTIECTISDVMFGWHLQPKLGMLFPENVGCGLRKKRKKKSSCPCVMNNRKQKAPKQKKKIVIAWKLLKYLNTGRRRTGSMIHISRFSSLCSSIFDGWFFFKMYCFCLGLLLCLDDPTGGGLLVCCKVTCACNSSSCLAFVNLSEPFYLYEDQVSFMRFK